uniref:HTH CENPB-type domain-containing protein n=1 Tax=Eptatretus burgeri TaxID=7764 RepID=A0A8C4QV77_EPTBU
MITMIVKKGKKKYDIIKFCEANLLMKKTDIAEKFDIKWQTLNDILKNKGKIFGQVGKIARLVVSVKRVSFEDVDDALIIWFRQMSAQPNIRLDGEMLLLKARKFAADLGHDDAETLPMHWIDRFKVRWGIGKVKKCGESGDVDLAVVHNWNDAVKIRVTLLVGANMDGTDKLPLYAIGKSKNPRAFKSVKHLPVAYSANKKAWITSALFEQWLVKLNRCMSLEKHKIAFVVDNCPAHPACQLENIELVFLPPNTTSHTQPMDGGVIRNLKLHYRQILATRRLNAADEGIPFKWDLLDVLIAAKTAWGKVSNATIVNCFRSVGFVNADHSAHEVDEESDDDHGNQFRNVWERLAEKFGSDVMPSLEKYINMDAELGSTQQMTDAEIVDSVKNVSDDTGNVDIVDLEDSGETYIPNAPPIIREAFSALDVMRQHCLLVEDCPDNIMEYNDRFESFLMHRIPKSLRQSNITDYCAQE